MTGLVISWELGVGMGHHSMNAFGDNSSNDMPLLEMFTNPCPSAVQHSVN